MGSKTRLGSYCTKRANNGVNLVTSRNINTRLARPMRQDGDRWHVSRVEALKTLATGTLATNGHCRDVT